LNSFRTKAGLNGSYFPTIHDTSVTTFGRERRLPVEIARDLSAMTQIDPERTPSVSIYGTLNIGKSDVNNRVGRQCGVRPTRTFPHGLPCEYS
jgi:hypothetical protein